MFPIISVFVKGVFKLKVKMNHLMIFLLCVCLQGIFSALIDYNQELRLSQIQIEVLFFPLSVCNLKFAFDNTAIIQRDTHQQFV